MPSTQNIENISFSLNNVIKNMNEKIEITLAYVKRIDTKLETLMSNKTSTLSNKPKGDDLLNCIPIKTVEGVNAIEIKLKSDSVFEDTMVTQILLLILKKKIKYHVSFRSIVLPKLVV